MHFVRSRTKVEVQLEFRNTVIQLNSCRGQMHFGGSRGVVAEEEGGELL